MAITTLQTAQSSLGFNYQAQGTATGSAYTATTAAGNPKEATNYTKGTNAAGQINEIYSTILSIAASSSTTLDLTSLADVLGNTVSFARIKGWHIQLLSAAQDTNGTAASSVTVGNAGSNVFPFRLAGTTPTFDVINGAAAMYDEPSANGITVDGTHKNVKILNNDAGLAAKVQVTFWGADA